MTSNTIASRTFSHRVALATMVVAAVAAGTAAAAGLELLTKAEVAGIAVDKKLQYVRASDGATVTFDVRGNGKVYFTPARVTRATTIVGAYTIDDDGRLCFKWEADRYVSMQDGCFAFRRAGDKIRVVGARNPDFVVGDLVQ